MRLVLFMGPSCVFNYKNVIELWVMETENSQNVFSVSITYNSKIRELSDGNKKLEIELWLAKLTFFWELRWIPPFFRIELWKLRIKWWELPIQTAPKIPYFIFLVRYSITWHGKIPSFIFLVTHSKIPYFITSRTDSNGSTARASFTATQFEICAFFFFFFC